ncbi:MAG: DUF262 domain-containing protein [Rhodopirellula sp.]|nr:DUF262 domain-containing protein [Rhodopirellula sp.]
MRKVDTNVNELVGMIERGELRLPEMQRRYVWRAPRVRDLLDSLYRGYPSGSVLVWETDREQPTRDLAVEQQDSPFAGHKLLLDGQQRLTSLSAVLRGRTVKVRGRKREIDILFNLEHPDGLGDFTEVVSDEESQLLDEDEVEENGDLFEDDGDEAGLQERLNRMTFVVASKTLAQKPNWVSVTRVFKSSDAEVLKAAGVTGFDDPRYAKYAERLKRLRNICEYPYSMHVLPRDLSYEEVAEIFVRVNSLGVKLRGSDLALAQITARWPNSLKLLEDFQEECEEYWMTLDLGLLVRAMVVFASGQSRFDVVRNLSVKALQDGWEKAKKGLRFAINFLKTNADIEDESLLSSPLFFIAIAYFSQARNERLSNDDERGLLCWLYVANARGRYSRGSTETLLDADLATIKRGGGPKELIETVRQQFGRLTIEPVDLAGRGAGSPLFSLIFLAMKQNGAKDWSSGLGLSLTHQGRAHYIQYHHVFPKSLLKALYETREINEIANMAFVAGRTNRSISNKEPSAYLPKIIEERGIEALAMQCVPTDPGLWTISNYRAFLEKRRSMIASLVNDFLQSVQPAGWADSVASAETAAS